MCEIAKNTYLRSCSEEFYERKLREINKSYLKCKETAIEDNTFTGTECIVSKCDYEEPGGVFCSWKNKYPKIVYTNIKLDETVDKKDLLKIDKYMLGHL